MSFISLFSYNYLKPKLYIVNVGHFGQTFAWLRLCILEVELIICAIMIKFVPILEIFFAVSHLTHYIEAPYKFLYWSKVFCNRSKLYRKWYSIGRRLLLHQNQRWRPGDRRCFFFKSKFSFTFIVSYIVS